MGCDQQGNKYREKKEKPNTNDPWDTEVVRNWGDGDEKESVNVTETEILWKQKNIHENVLCW